MSHEADWDEAGLLLREALENYQVLKGYSTLTQAIDDLANFIPGRNYGEGLSDKMIRRYMSGRAIPRQRIELCAEWFRSKALITREWIEKWIEQTDHPRPGELLEAIYSTQGIVSDLYKIVKRNSIPSLRGVLWGKFLGREKELETLIRWADYRHNPIAILWGFGGNGKTTLQLKVANDFVYGVSCPLRWPYEAIVWITSLDYPNKQLDLQDILRTVLETFRPQQELPELGQVSPIWIRKEARKLLAKNRVLILLDNFETIVPSSKQEILSFFSSMEGSSKILISTRYQLAFDTDNLPHYLIPVGGLESEHVNVFMQDYLKSRALPITQFKSTELKRLANVTRNNPKAIVAILGLVEKGISLSNLLDNLSEGSVNADDIFDKVIGEAWKSVLSENEKAVLMAKAFFSQPTQLTSLGYVSGLELHQVLESAQNLQAISFFDRFQQGQTQVYTHPLAQEFAKRILHDEPTFEQEANHRWWSVYLPVIISQTQEITYKNLLANPEFSDEVISVIEQLLFHIFSESRYSCQAADVIAGKPRFGYILSQLGMWDETVRLAEVTLQFAIHQERIDWVQECGLSLLCSIYEDRHELDKAEWYLSQVIEFNVVHNDEVLQAIIETKQGTLHRKRGHFKASKQLFESALTKLKQNSSATAYDIGLSLIRQAGMVIEVSVLDLDTAIDINKVSEKGLQEAEILLNEAEIYFNQSDPLNKFERVSVRAWRGVIARLRGNLPLAKDLFNSCFGQFQSLTSVARLYRELSLVEHLLGNKDLAYQYDEKGEKIFEQLNGIATKFHYLRVIDEIKKNDKW